jgi:hypothetical protein
VAAYQGWHDFYVTAGAAAATLAGLLFVGLSLHLRVVVTHREVRGLARITLSNFFVVLVIALLLLAPPQPDRAVEAELLGVAATAVALMLRPLVQALRARRARTISLRVLAGRFLVSGLAYAGLAALALLLGSGQLASALQGLLIVVLVLLMIAVRNTWDLLVTVADRGTGS